MKKADVVIGERYFARIGSELAPVIVLAFVPAIATWERDGFRIQRDAPGEFPLPKLRTAAALRTRR